MKRQRGLKLYQIQADITRQKCLWNDDVRTKDVYSLEHSPASSMKLHLQYQKQLDPFGRASVETILVC